MSRRILIGIDDSDASEDAVKWALRHVYRRGDEVHLIHVIPRLQLSVTTHHGGDYLPYEQPGAYKQAIERSEAFITKRALKYTNDVEPPPVVHIVKYETDCESVGAMLCKKAEDLKAAVTVVAKHDKTMAQQFFLGSVSNYCVQHAKQPVVVHH